MVRAYSDYNGNKPLGAPGERYVAKVYSGYGDLNSHGNVARVYSNYSTPDLRMTPRNPIYSEGHVARAVVRQQRDGALDRIDEYSDVASSTPAVHVAHKELPKAQLNRPVTRTQSYQDRSPTRHLRPGSLIRPTTQSNDQPASNSLPGHKPLDRSSSDAHAHAQRRLERKPMEEPHSKVSRSRSADQQLRALPKLPHDNKPQTEVATPVKDAFTPGATDAGRDVHSHIYASLGEATSSSSPRNTAADLSSNSLQRISITEEDPSALYALPMKVKRPQTEGGSGRSKATTEAQSPSPPPPPPPPPLRPLSESKRQSPRNSVVNSMVKSLEASSESKKVPDIVKKESPKQLPPKTSPKPVSPKDSKPKVLPTKPSPPKESMQKDIIPMAPKETPVTKAPSSDLQTTKLEIKDEPKSVSKVEKTPTKSGESENDAGQKLESDSESVTYANAGKLT